MKRSTFLLPLAFLALPLNAVLAQETPPDDGSSDACATCDLSPIVVHLSEDTFVKGLGGVRLKHVVVVAPATEIPVVLPTSIENALEFLQTNDGDILAVKSIAASKVPESAGEGLLEASATAVANIANIDTFDDLALETAQLSTGNIEADLDVISGIDGPTDLTSTALVNSIGAATTGSAVFDIIQESNGDSVIANLDAEIFGGGVGEVNTAALAIANNLTLEFGGTASGTIDQRNIADVTAINTDIIDRIRDPNTSIAIGNNITVTRISIRP